MDFANVEQPIVQAFADAERVLAAIVRPGSEPIERYPDAGADLAHPASGESSMPCRMHTPAP
jgi:hypothetical protein